MHIDLGGSEVSGNRRSSLCGAGQDTSRVHKITTNATLVPSAGDQTPSSSCTTRGRPSGSTRRRTAPAPARAAACVLLRVYAGAGPLVSRQARVPGGW